jgi:hypothetical protein
MSVPKLSEIERLASEMLKDVATRPVEESSHTRLRIEENMRRVAELDHSFAAEAAAIGNAARLLYGVDRAAVHRHPGGRQLLKSELAGRLKMLKARAQEKISRSA